MSKVVSIKNLAKKFGVSNITVIREAGKLGVEVIKVRSDNDQIMNMVSLDDAKKIVDGFKNRQGISAEEIPLSVAAEEIGVTVAGFRKKLLKLKVKTALRQLASGQVGTVIKKSDFKVFKVEAKAQNEFQEVTI